MIEKADLYTLNELVDEFTDETSYISNRTVVSNEEIKPSIMARSAFADSFKAGTMLVKSTKNGEVKTIKIDNALVLRNPVTLNSINVRNARVTPKVNYDRN